MNHRITAKSEEGLPEIWTYLHDCLNKIVMESANEFIKVFIFL